MESFNLNISLRYFVFRNDFLSVNSDCRVQCPKNGARGQMKDTAAGGIHATHGTFSSLYC